MSEVLKFNCNSSTYINNLDIYKNNSKSNSLLCGLKKDSEYTNYFSSIFNFSKINLEYSSIKSAFIFLYILKIDALKQYPTNLCMTSYLGDLDISNLNYDNIIKNTIINPLPINFSSKIINSYTKINITSIIRKLLNKNSNFNIILKTMNDYPTYLLNIASSNSLNPPYIEITLKDKNINYSNNVDPTIIKNSNNNNNNSNINYINILEKLETQSAIISNMINQLINIQNSIQNLNELLSNHNRKILKSDDAISHQDITKKTNTSSYKEAQNYPNVKSAIKIVHKNTGSKLKISSNKKS